MGKILVTQASRKAPQRIEPFFKPGEEPVQEQLEVFAEKVVLRLKKLPNIERTWDSASLEFSDGKKISIAFRNTEEPQEFSFPATKTTFVRLTDLKQSFPLVDCGIVELEVYGKDQCREK